jgi:hypothetical protein
MSFNQIGGTKTLAAYPEKVKALSSLLSQQLKKWKAQCLLQKRRQARCSAD